MKGQDKFEEIIRLLESPSNDLLSGQFYNDLNHNIVGSRKYFKDCDLLKSVPNGNYFRIYCAQMVKYLKTKYSTTNRKNYEFDDCTLLNYWIIGKLVQYYGSHTDSNFIRAFGVLKHIWSNIIPDDSSISSNNICNSLFDIYNQADWYKRKEFYDYCVDYDTLLNTANSYDKSCEEYYMYIESKIPIYKHIKKLCTPENAITCPNFYAKCKERDPQILLSKLKCHTRMQEKMAALKKGKATDDAVTYPDQGADSALTGRTGLQDPLQKSHGSSSTVTKASNAFLGVVVTSMTSGFLYKFTPLGTHLRNRFGYNRNAISINRGDNGLFDYASESFNPYPGGEEHNIGYHPA